MKSWLHFDPNEKLTRADALSLTAAACAVFSGTAHLGLAWRHYQDSPVAGLLFGLMGIWQLYAAYGGVFIAAATLWGRWVDGRAPDRWDWLGVALILWMPRR